MHRRGSLAKAVLASARGPAIFPPVVYDGELHVDGGVLNNVPVDVMKSFVNGGIVIGVDVFTAARTRIWSKTMVTTWTAGRS